MRIPLLTILLLTSTLVLALRANADPIAIIAAMEGKVEVTIPDSDTPKRAAFGMQLEKGDRVSVGKGATATLLFSDGNVIELSEQSSVTVSTSIEKSDKNELPGEVYDKVNRYITGGFRETGLVAQMKMRGVEHSRNFIISPRETSILDTRPKLTWGSAKGASRYIVTLSSDEGDLWKLEVTDTSLIYPATAPNLLDDAFYIWEVEARSDVKPLSRESTDFHVLPSTMVDQVRADMAAIEEILGDDSPALHFVSGSYLSSLGLYQDALEHFQILCRLSPKTPGPYEALGNLYAEIGLNDFASIEYQKALSLSKTP